VTTLTATDDIATSQSTSAQREIMTLVLLDLVTDWHLAHRLQLDTLVLCYEFGGNVTAQQN